MHQKVN